MHQIHDLSECDLQLWEESFDAEDAAAYAGPCETSVEFYDERQASSVGGDDNIIRKIPNFPNGKDRHYFVSHSSEDFKRVLKIIEELENRFKLNCILSDRNFQIGKNILHNINESMQRSMKILLMMSPNFISSPWCRYELENVLIEQIKSGLCLVVPVLLEKCEVPKTLGTVTYIDATLPGVDIPARIADALTRPELAEGQSQLQEPILLNRYNSGYCVTIPAKREPRLRCRPSIYKFSLDKDVPHQLQLANITLPNNVLEDACSEMNRYRTVWGYEYINSKENLICWIVMFLPIWIFLATLGIVLVSHGRNIVSLDDIVYIFIGVFVLTVFLLGLSSALFEHIWIGYNKREKSEVLQSLLWKKMQKVCLKNNVLLLYEHTQTTAPTLYVMRYNIKQCQDYLEGLIRSRSFSCNDEVLPPEEYAEKLMEDYARYYQRMLTPRLDGELQDAPYNRHNVKNEKMCLCQYIENLKRV